VRAGFCVIAILCYLGQDLAHALNKALGGEQLVLTHAACEERSAKCENQEPALRL
jgi:hypothetical protein